MTERKHRPKPEQSSPEPPEDELDEAVWESFPASDPPAPAAPERTEQPPERRRRPRKSR